MPPITMMIKPVSGRCNMRCSYCFYADEQRNRAVPCYAAMSEQTLEHVVRKAFAYADGSVSFVFQGGEPTLAGTAFYRSLLRLEKTYNSRGLPVHHALQTNGYHMPDELMDVLLEGRFLLGVSVDGTQAIHDSRRLDAGGQGTYLRIMDNIARLKARGIPYNILCVVDNAIAAQPDACYRELRRHGYVQYIACLEPFGQQNTVLQPELYGDFLLSTFRHYACDLEAGRYVSIRLFDNWLNMLCGRPPELCSMRGVCSIGFLIESNGDVFPCDFYALDEWRMGNVTESNFRRLIKGDAAQRFVAASQQADAACADCRWHPLCRGGCRREREPLTQGTPLTHFRLCRSYQRFFEQAYPMLERLAAMKPPQEPVQS